MLMMLLEKKIQSNRLFLKDIIRKMKKHFRMLHLKHWKDKNYLMQAELHKINLKKQMLKD
jgi:hypothetical protein